MSDSRDIFYAGFGFCFGIFCFFKGFQRLRRKRLIENIPTSTIRALAMGLVELQGKTRAASMLTSPLTNTQCVLYEYKVEEYRKSGKSGHWVTIAKGNSFYSPFWLEDETGKIMVFPTGSEIIWPRDYCYSTGLGRGLPDNLTHFCESNSLRYRHWLGNRRLRFTEWFIREGETVYVMGCARKQKNDIVASHKEALMERLRKLKDDPAKMKEVDTNQDGTISMEEWDAAVAKIEQEVIEQALTNTPVDDPLDVFIGKGDEEPVFIISDHSEKSLLSKLQWQSFLGIYGGAALSLALLAYLLFRFGIF